MSEVHPEPGPQGTSRRARRDGLWKRAQKLGCERGWKWRESESLSDSLVLEFCSCGAKQVSRKLQADTLQSVSVYGPLFGLLENDQMNLNIPLRVI